jgi:hypothetical protein
MASTAAARKGTNLSSAKYATCLPRILKQHSIKRLPGHDTKASAATRLAVGCWVRHEALPIGVQVIGRPYEEEVVLDVAAVIENGFGYSPPPLALPTKRAAGQEC